MVSKGVLFAILASVMVAGGGAVAVAVNNNANDSPYAHCDITGFEILDTCPYMEKSRELFDVEWPGCLSEESFVPFLPDECKWVKITADYELHNAGLWIASKYGGFSIKLWFNGMARIGTMGLYNPAYYTGFEPKQVEADRSGTLEMWFLIPIVAETSDPGLWDESKRIPWKDITMDTLRLKVQTTLDN